MALDVKRLAAAQAHARSRQEHRAMEEMRLEMARQQQMAAQQAHRERKKGRVLGGIQGLLGLGATIGGAFSGNPMMLGGGISAMGSGLGTALGAPEIGSLAGGVGQMAAAGMMQAQQNEQMQNLADQLKADNAAYASAMNDALGYGKYTHQGYIDSKTKI